MALPDAKVTTGQSSAEAYSVGTYVEIEPVNRKYVAFHHDIDAKLVAPLTGPGAINATINPKIPSQLVVFRNYEDSSC